MSFCIREGVYLFLGDDTFFDRFRKVSVQLVLQHVTEHGVRSQASTG
jgi:hypothetical protein